MATKTAHQGQLCRLKELSQAKLQILLAVMSATQQSYHDGDHLIHLVSVTPVKKGWGNLRYDVIVYVQIHAGDKGDVYVGDKLSEPLCEFFPEEFEYVPGRKGVIWLVQDPEYHWSFTTTDPAKKKSRKRRR